MKGRVDDMPDEMLTPRELSEELKVPEKTLAQWRYLGRGPSYQKLEGHVRYTRPAVAAWRASCERGAPGAA